MKEYKLAICLNVGFGEAMEKVYESAKKAGFDGFFVNWNRENVERIKALSQTAKKDGMIFQSIHAPFNRINKLWHEDEQTEDVINEQIECIKTCAELSVPVMVIHPFIGFEKPNVTPNGIKNFAKIVKVAEELKVNLAFENVENEEYLAEIIKCLGSSKRVGFCWDTGHQQCYNLGTDVMKKYANGKLFCTHFNDNLGCSNPNEITWLDDAHLLPYDGIVDWKWVMSQINAIGFEGIITFELTRENKPTKHTHDKYANLSLDEFLQEAYKRARRVVGEMVE